MNPRIIPGTLVEVRSNEGLDISTVYSCFMSPVGIILEIKWGGVLAQVGLDKLVWDNLALIYVALEYHLKYTSVGVGGR